jgi:hypothetical protein
MDAANPGCNAPPNPLCDTLFGSISRRKSYSEPNRRRGKRLVIAALNRAGLSSVDSVSCCSKGRQPFAEPIDLSETEEAIRAKLQ